MIFKITHLVLSNPKYARGGKKKTTTSLHFFKTIIKDFKWLKLIK